MEKPIHPSVVDLHARMFANRLRIKTVIRRAGLSSVTWWRWTQGVEPKMSNLDKVSGAIDQIVAEKELKNAEA